MIHTGLDWLAVELLDAVSQGSWPEESNDVLVRARAHVRAGGAERPTFSSKGFAAPTQIGLDEQVKWAEHYVLDRLDQALADLEGGLVNLDAILFKVPGKADAAQRVERIRVVVGAGDGAAAVSRDDVLKARDGMAALREALQRWSSGEDVELTP